MNSAELPWPHFRGTGSGSLFVEGGISPGRYAWHYLQQCYRNAGLDLADDPAAQEVCEVTGLVDAQNDEHFVTAVDPHMLPGTGAFYADSRHVGWARSPATQHEDST